MLSLRCSVGNCSCLEGCLRLRLRKVHRLPILTPIFFRVLLCDQVLTLPRLHLSLELVLLSVRLSENPALPLLENRVFADQLWAIEA